MVAAVVDAGETALADAGIVLGRLDGTHRHPEQFSRQFVTHLGRARKTSAQSSYREVHPGMGREAAALYAQQRHRRLDGCLSHGGGVMPFLYGRVRDWVATGAAPVGIEQFDRDYARLWFDTHLHSGRSAQLLTEVANADRLVFGTNFGGWDSATATEADSLPIDLSANTRTLLRLS